MTAARLTALVSGHVQGVGFREWTRRTAAPLGLVGSASNLPDGRVEVIAEGDRDACDQLLAALQGGSTPGRVRDVQVAWSDADNLLVGFVTD
ncbi:acylphosphatase [uncultured Jatrophihabitans sp.]|uniref:acylphosphatase n=1 Tax=uncultured Jatrophihabitans sp. TaxID=1610747 RepID=UPI0035CC080E